MPAEGSHLEIVNIVNIEPDALEQVTLLPAKAGPTSATPTAATETGVVKAKTMANSLTHSERSSTAEVFYSQRQRTTRPIGEQLVYGG